MWISFVSDVLGSFWDMSTGSFNKWKNKKWWANPTETKCLHDPHPSICLSNLYLNYSISSIMHLLYHITMSFSKRQKLQTRISQSYLCRQGQREGNNAMTRGWDKVSRPRPAEWCWVIIQSPWPSYSLDSCSTLLTRGGISEPLQIRDLIVNFSLVD